MQTERTLLDDLKHQFKNGDMTIRLIFVNTVIFLFIGILNVIGNLTLGSTQTSISLFVQTVFTISTDYTKTILTPWGLITSMFAHFSFFHFLFNMIMLYFSGKMFEQFFSGKRLLNTYLLGGIIGVLVEILARSVFPVFENKIGSIVGASGSIMAIFMAAALYKPNFKVMLFGIRPVKLIYIAAFYFVSELLSSASNDGTAHFVHIGGALLGALSIQNLNSSKNIISRFQKVTDALFLFFKRLAGKNTPNLKVKYGESNSTRRVKTDEEYNYEAKQRQIQVDAILDKIAKSGYESLSKAEKQFLFDQSKNAK